MRGLVALREMELKETYRIVFALKDGANRVSCSSTQCPSQNSKGALDAGVVGAHQRAVDQIAGSAVGATRILQVLQAGEFTEDAGSKFCQVCVEKMQAGHAEMRKKAWAVLPEVFGLRT